MMVIKQIIMIMTFVRTYLVFNSDDVVLVDAFFFFKQKLQNQATRVCLRAITAHHPTEPATEDTKHHLSRLGRHCGVQAS